MVQKGLALIHKVPTKENGADVLKKIVTGPGLRECLDQIENYDVTEKD